jgi:hypothetical protein
MSFSKQTPDDQGVQGEEDFSIAERRPADACLKPAEPSFWLRFRGSPGVAVKSINRCSANFQRRLGNYPRLF